MLTVYKHNYNFNIKHFYLRYSFSKGKVGKTEYFWCNCSINSKYFLQRWKRKWKYLFLECLFYLAYSW